MTSWQRIRSVISRKQCGSGKTPGPAVADDLVKRDFRADGPNQLWLTDITEHKTPWILAIVATLVTSALANAVARRRDVTVCVVHRDQGSQSRSQALQEVLTRHGLILSMVRVASAADNAAMGSFHSLLQGNVLDRQTWDTRDQLRQAIVTWIETTYHRRRRQDRLGRLGPGARFCDM